MDSLNWLHKKLFPEFEDPTEALAIGVASALYASILVTAILIESILFWSLGTAFLTALCLSVKAALSGR